MTTLGIHPQQDDEQTAETMLYEARISLALLQRYAAAMTRTTEGRAYLYMIHDVCTHGADWAPAHLTLTAAAPPRPSGPQPSSGRLGTAAPAGANSKKGHQ